jgi:hypothetical protein
LALEAPEAGMVLPLQVVATLSFPPLHLLEEVKEEVVPTRVLAEVLAAVVTAAAAVALAAQFLVAQVLPAKVTLADLVVAAAPTPVVVVVVALAEPAATCLHLELVVTQGLACRLLLLEPLLLEQVVVRVVLLALPVLLQLVVVVLQLPTMLATLAMAQQTLAAAVVDHITIQPETAAPASLSFVINCKNNGTFCKSGRWNCRSSNRCRA